MASGGRKLQDPKFKEKSKDIMVEVNEQMSTLYRVFIK